MEEVKLKIVISIELVRRFGQRLKDSQFYINLAGVIGEKFMRLPGSAAAWQVEPNSLVPWRRST